VPPALSLPARIAHVLHLGLAHQRAGRPFFAQACYRKILEIDPHHAEALHLLGLLAQQAGNYEAAIKLIGAAIQSSPHAAHYHNNLGNTYFRALDRPQAGSPKAASGAGLPLVLPSEGLHPSKPRPGFHPNAPRPGASGTPEDAAIICYRRALELQPNYADAHYNLAQAYLRQARLPLAAEALRRAVALQPACARFFCSLGHVLSRQGEVEEAEACYHRVLALQPDYAEVQHNLGNRLQRRGDLAAAAECYRCALALKPTLAVSHHHLAGILAEMGDLPGALAGYRRAIELQPDYSEACTNLAILLEKEGDLGGAMTACRSAVRAKPTSARAHSNLAAVLSQAGEPTEALAMATQALTLQPTCAEAHTNLAGILWQQGRYAEAVASCRRAIALQPDCVAAYCNLGSALADLGDLDGALESYRKVLALQPDSAAATYYSGLIHLQQGDLARGWTHYEARWHLKSMGRKRRNFPQPLWRGESLNGARILLYAEQGLGDILQFVRYVPMVAERGGHVILQVPPALRRLLHGLPGVSELLPFGETLPDFAWQCPLMSLPRAFATELSSIPASVPYLYPHPSDVQSWQHKLDCGERLRVGLVWAGNPKHVRNRQRSLALGQLAPLAEVEGVSYYALQKGLAPAPAGPAWPEGAPLTDLGPQQHDLADAAAIVSSLDLVISADTAVAHLTGALGKPVWILLQFMPDWRWLLHREDSPWYPTARLFRQPVLGDWDSVLQRVTAELKQLSQTMQTDKRPNHSGDASRYGGGLPIDVRMAT